MTRQPPEPNHVEDGNAADAGQDGQTGEPDPLLAFLVGEESRAARAEHRGQGCDQENLGQHFETPIHELRIPYRARFGRTVQPVTR